MAERIRLVLEDCGAREQSPKRTSPNPVMTTLAA